MNRRAAGRSCRYKVIAALIMVGMGIAIAYPSHSASGVEISLVTCSSGKDLYATFGHSALRVRDSIAGTDQLFNYGTFNFNTPNFYWKFVRGKLPYQLSIETLPQFLASFKEPGRIVYQEPLLLTDQQQREVLHFLSWNYRPENREYYYDFFYDNCSTRIRDLVENELGAFYPQKVSEGPHPTLRQLLHEKLTRMPWTRVGIDLILGRPADRLADHRAQMFLPSYLSDNLGAARIDRSPLLGDRELLLKTPGSLPVSASAWWQKPGFILTAFTLLLALPTLLRRRRPTRWTDAFLAVVLALLGFFYLFMMYGTDHEATKANWNFFWANPLFLIALLTPQGSALRLRLFQLLSVATILLLITWSWLPQQLPYEVMPLVALLAVRYSLTARRLQ